MTTSVSGRESVGDPGRDVHAAVVVAGDVEALRRAVGRTALAEIVQHDPRGADRHVPVVALVEVVVQSDERTLLLVRPVALDHLARAGNHSRR